MSINLIIFSKNRCMMLEALLYSLHRNFTDRDKADVTVIFKATNDSYKKGYESLGLAWSSPGFHKFKSLTFLPETKNFKQDVLSSISSNNKYTAFLVDDILFKESFSLKDSQFKLLDENKEILSVSLRLWKGIAKCYALNDKPTIPPTFVKGCVWKWTEASEDWGYSGSLDGDIFRTELFLNLWLQLSFSNPNEFEAVLNSILTHLYKNTHPYMCCYTEQSRLVNIPTNRVQEQFRNRTMNSFTAEELHEKFMASWYIDEAETGKKCKDNDSVHFEIDYVIKKVP